jgi:hypothetical protein
MEVRGRPVRIPSQLISVLCEVIVQAETHASMNNLFMYANAPGDPPDGSKPIKAQAWLRRIEQRKDIDALEVLGLLIEGYMEPPLRAASAVDAELVLDEFQKTRIATLEAALKRANLRYFPGGMVCRISGSPTRSLQAFIEKLDYGSVNQEFERAIGNVESNPRESVSAASNILESVFKIYIESNSLAMPSNIDIQSLWKVVKINLGLDPSGVEDRDLKEILSGLAAMVNGIGSLRSHASSAHGAGKKTYKLQPRHARLAIHAAHTLAIFVLESWEERKRVAVISPTNPSL